MGLGIYPTKLQTTTKGKNFEKSNALTPEKHAMVGKKIATGFHLFDSHTIDAVLRLHGAYP